MADEKSDVVSRLMLWVEREISCPDPETLINEAISEIVYLRKRLADAARNTTDYALRCGYYEGGLGIIETRLVEDPVAVATSLLDRFDDSRGKVRQ